MPIYGQERQGGSTRRAQAPTVDSKYRWKLVLMHRPKMYDYADFLDTIVHDKSEYEKLSADAQVRLLKKELQLRNDWEKMPDARKLRWQEFEWVPSKVSKSYGPQTQRMNVITPSLGSGEDVKHATGIKTGELSGPGIPVKDKPGKDKPGVEQGSGWVRTGERDVVVPGSRGETAPDFTGAGSGAVRAQKPNPLAEPEYGAEGGISAYGEDEEFVDIPKMDYRPGKDMNVEQVEAKYGIDPLGGGFNILMAIYQLDGPDGSKYKIYDHARTARMDKITPDGNVIDFGHRHNTMMLSRAAEIDAGLEQPADTSSLHFTALPKSAELQAQAGEPGFKHDKDQETRDIRYDTLEDHLEKHIPKEYEGWNFLEIPKESRAKIMKDFFANASPEEIKSFEEFREYSTGRLRRAADDPDKGTGRRIRGLDSPPVKNELTGRLELRTDIPYSTVRGEIAPKLAGSRTKILQMKDKLKEFVEKYGDMARYSVAAVKNSPQSIQWADVTRCAREGCGHPISSHEGEFHEFECNDCETQKEQKHALPVCQSFIAPSKEVKGGRSRDNVRVFNYDKQRVLELIDSLDTMASRDVGADMKRASKEKFKAQVSDWIMPVAKKMFPGKKTLSDLSKEQMAAIVSQLKPEQQDYIKWQGFDDVRGRDITSALNIVRTFIWRAYMRTILSKYDEIRKRIFEKNKEMLLKSLEQRSDTGRVDPKTGKKTHVVKKFDWPGRFDGDLKAILGFRGPGSGAGKSMDVPIDIPKDNKLAWSAFTRGGAIDTARIKGLRASIRRSIENAVEEEITPMKNEAKPFFAALLLSQAGASELAKSAGWGVEADLVALTRDNGNKVVARAPHIAKTKAQTSDPKFASPYVPDEKELEKIANMPPGAAKGVDVVPQGAEISAAEEEEARRQRALAAGIDPTTGNPMGLQPAPKMPGKAAPARPGPDVPTQSVPGMFGGPTKPRTGMSDDEIRSWMARRKKEDREFDVFLSTIAENVLRELEG